MIFLDRTEVEKRRASLQRKIVSNPKPVFRHDSSSKQDNASAARTFVASLGNFNEASLLCVSFPFGDGRNEPQSSDPRWVRYGMWREAYGETRRPYEAPGQHLASSELDTLTEAIDFTLQLGWDAYLEADRGRKLLVFSHDDRVEIHRGFERHTLTRDLLRLGCWQVAGPAYGQGARRALSALLAAEDRSTTK